MKKGTLLFLLYLVVVGMAYAQEVDKDDPFESSLPAPKVDDQGRIEAPVSGPPPISIEGVLWGTAVGQAIIDGDVYKVGDTLKKLDAKIYKIEKNSVFIFYGGKLFEMHISKKEEK